jgi:hypothetical protein
MTLKKLIKEALSPYKGKRFGVVAFELRGNAKDGFDYNSSFFLTKDSDIDGALEAAQGRWNAFKGNYMPRARVKDISWDNPGEGIMYFECSCVPFLEIRVY